MKPLLRYVLILVIFAGCATIEPIFIPESTESYGFDFRPYSEKGFLFTPGEYSGEFDAIGLVTFGVWPAADFIQRRVTSPSGISEMSWVWRVDTVSTEAAIETAYNMAVDMGANALTHFSIRTRTRSLPHSGSMDGIEVNGYAIDRR